MMKTITRLLSIGLLAYWGDAQSDSTMSTVEQYCFPRIGGPFTADSVLPSVTMILNGTTWTTTPVVATFSSTRQVTSSNTVFDNTGTQIAAPTIATAFITTPSSPLTTSPASIPSSGPSGVSSITPTDNNTLPVATSISLSIDSVTHSSSTSVASTSNTPLSINSIPMIIGNSTANTAQSTLYETIKAPLRSIVPVITSGNRINPATRETPAPSILPSLAGPSSNQTSSAPNETLSLSAAAVDALQLALFLKNLEISLFSSNVSFSENATPFSPGLVDLLTNISQIQQEQMQHVTLQALLRRAGGGDIPPCQYTFPANTTELVFLMHAFKVIEVGVHLSVVASLAPTDVMVGTLLSSIASVAARQDVLLCTATNSGTSLTSFETLLSGTWAYNFALRFTRPGSCMAELPIPILPTLSLNSQSAGFARAGSKITLGWDVAAGAAISRSGKPLFVGWVNQIDTPVYTPLTPVGDLLGTTDVPVEMFGTSFTVLTAQPGIVDINELTDATLAGPVMVSLLA